MGLPTNPTDLWRSVAFVLLGWIVARLAVRHGFRRWRIGAKETWPKVVALLSPFGWRPWLALGLTLYAAGSWSQGLWQQRSFVEALVLPEGWDLTMHEPWTDWMVANGVYLRYSASGPVDELIEQLDSWALTAPWNHRADWRGQAFDRRLDVTSDELRAAPDPFWPAPIRETLVVTLPWTVDSLIRTEKHFRLIYRSRGDPLDYMEGLAVRVIDDGPEVSTVEIWIHWISDL